MWSPKGPNCVISLCPVLPRRASIRGGLHHYRLQDVLPESEHSVRTVDAPVLYVDLLSIFLKASSSLFRRHLLIQFSVDLPFAKAQALL